MTPLLTERMKARLIHILCPIPQSYLANSVGMPTTVACVHVLFIGESEYWSDFHIFPQYLSRKNIQIDSLFVKDSTDEIMTLTGFHL